ncbi:YebO family protein [Pectobacterium brasiliense]|uniref:YebO family protein n=1 Tax=Pectobacterium brasiliense TaxID=180957 RepID=A0AAE3BDB6_9GAMM|nr:YebO family protein [Pectobacterium brasiliense]MBA0215778.1 YebO family protein [Pectobacterium brasiliense]MBN3050662.1 YebO family protein [Pectobacterium brasiliense]MBN3072652.1 YebO family protein [Pectobacterium brasiliense]MBN3168414.1 YebO family protein [Pectobacterium brasiliense]
MNILEVVFVLLIVLLAALVWFFVNRASVRANEQVKLLQEIVEQQRQQLALLKKLLPQNAEKSEPETFAAERDRDDVELTFKSVIPER